MQVKPPLVSSLYLSQPLTLSEIQLLMLLKLDRQNEKYFDLIGSLGFLSCTAFSLYFPTLRSRFYLGQNVPFPAITSFHPRQLLISGLTVLWAGRLGSFLFQVRCYLYTSTIKLNFLIRGSASTARIRALTRSRRTRSSSLASGSLKRLVRTIPESAPSLINSYT